MKVIIDSAIPYIRGVVEAWADVDYVEGAAIDRGVVCDADALIVRTRTRCDRALLEGSSVKFIATATIGRDHIDEAYCRSVGIEVRSAAGCNARAVLQWVAAALRHMLAADRRSPEEYTLGVVGVGNVGSLVSRYARHWGFRVLECDPPRYEREGGEFYDISHIARNADIITLHTPLDSSTRHLVDERLLEIMRPEATILNASRGAVVDGRAVVKSAHRYAFDVWEGEPRLDAEVLERAVLATPHIAGYSQQGKANATAMVIRELCNYFALPLVGWYPSEVSPVEPRLIDWREVCSTIDDYCPIAEQSARLKMHPEEFESMRNNYLLRQEYF